MAPSQENGAHETAAPGRQVPVPEQTDRLRAMPPSQLAGAHCTSAAG
jgi:hypothetical protein